MTASVENFTRAMSLVKDVIDGKIHVNELREWIANFSVLFDSDSLAPAKYKQFFIDGNLKGFAESCPLMQEDKVREVIDKFWSTRYFDHKFIFLPKELAEHAATIHGYKTGLQAGQLFNLRNKTQ